MTSPGFTHLHVHTEYSLLDGLSKIHKSSALFDHVKNLGMDAIAITDHGAMHGVIEFYKAARANEVKPIIGMEGYITDGDHKNKSKEQSTFHLLLLAKNHEGYQNLMRLTSIANIDGYYYRPRVDHDLLKKYSKGLICTSTCIQGEIPQLILKQSLEKARAKLGWYLDIFGEDFYIELQRHEYAKHAPNAALPEVRANLLSMAEEEKKVNEGLVSLSRELGVPLIATNDAHYVKREDARAQDALVCVSTGAKVDEIKRLRFIDSPSFYINSPEEMAELFHDYPDSLSNTLKIRDKCEVEIDLNQWFFPSVEVPKGKTPNDVLLEESWKGAKEKFGDKLTPEIQERLTYELEIISQKGYAAYFIAVAEITSWAAKHGIITNTRGSAAGSLVSYCMGIININPLQYGLTFERFLTPWRPTPPDIDLDIADDRREEIIDHLIKRFGEDKVAQICTFGRMLSRAAVRDVARVLGYPYEVGDRIAKLIPPPKQGFPITIPKALVEVPELKNLYDTDKDAKNVLDLSIQLEGTARHVSVHAAGVVIAPGDLTDYVPVKMEKGRKVTQYDMGALDPNVSPGEAIGLLKFDLLGLRNLSILGAALSLVKQTHNKTIDLAGIPLEDGKTFEMLGRGETMGVFQLSSSGMTKWLTELKPTRVEDLMAMVALYRPGPMDFIPEYIERKRNPSKVSYIDPRMEEYMGKSYGLMIYQEDVLLTAINIAGYSWEESDKFRKAVGKKIPEEMAKQHDKFVEGCVKNGLERKKAEDLFKMIEKFAAYGFNKAHSASYGMVAYWTAYMKANFPVDYMTALMTAEHGDLEKISAAIAESKRMGIKVLPPDINESVVAFTVVDDAESLDGKAIRFGLSAIKNVGNAAIEAILGARSDGPFVSFANFCARVDTRKVNKKVMESLIKVGALSQYGSRAGLLDVLEDVRQKTKSSATNGQQGLFAVDEEIKASSAAIERIQSNVPEFDDKQLGFLERELLGISLSAHSIFDLLGPIMAKRTHSISELLQSGDKQAEVVIACMVTTVRVINTKKTNAVMAFAKVEDDTGSMDVVVFPKLYEKTKAMWEANTTLLLSGKVDDREDNRSLLVDTAVTSDVTDTRSGKYQIIIPKATTNSQLTKLIETLRVNKGENEAIFKFEKAESGELKLPFGVTWSASLAGEVADILKNK